MRPSELLLWMLLISVMLFSVLLSHAPAIPSLTPPARVECQEIWMPIAEDEEQEVFVQMYVCYKPKKL